MESLDNASSPPPALIPSDVLTQTSPPPLPSSSSSSSSKDSDAKYGIGQLQRFLVKADEENKYSRWPVVEIRQEGYTVFRNCMVGSRNGDAAYVSFDAEPDVKYLLFSSFFSLPAILNIDNDWIKMQTTTTTSDKQANNNNAASSDTDAEKESDDSFIITVEEPGTTKDAPPNHVRIDTRTILVDKYTAGLFEGLLRSIVRQKDGQNVSIVVVEKLDDLAAPNPQWHVIFTEVADKLHRLTLKAIEQVKVQVNDARSSRKHGATKSQSSSSKTPGNEPQIEVTQTKRGSRKQVVTTMSVDQVTSMMEEIALHDQQHQ